jgi:DNA invertase Pin-like site-specific DNA recombinase
MEKFVSYLRVSTDRQGKSGLGLEAQRHQVEQHLNSVGGDLVLELVEVESGKRNNRPKLHEAIALAKAYNATLIIAKLDRLSWNALFLLSLKEAGVKFVAADNPSANNLTIGILALIAEHEREAISDRVRRALAASKARGTKLGGYRGYKGSATDLEKAREARTAKANNKARDYQLLFDRLNPDGSVSLKAMAQKLNHEGVPTPSGKGQWQHVQVARAYKRLAA